MKPSLGQYPNAVILRALLEGLDNRGCAGRFGLLVSENCVLVTYKGGVPYVMPKTNDVMNAKGYMPWRNMVRLFRLHPHAVNRFYRLLERAEAGWHSLKSLVGYVVRSKTVQMTNVEV